jgi:predicted nuclease of predicted toxin-antitoxin system
LKVWLDAQLSPSLASWISRRFKVEAFAIREVGLRDAMDAEIFEAARRANAIVVTKDRDFLELLARRGPPPKVIWVTSGNTSNARMKRVLAKSFPRAIDLLSAGESLVELTDLP